MDDDEKSFAQWGLEAEKLLKPILEKSNRGGFVYLMWVRKFRACKIGLTQKNPAKRRQAVMRGLPYEVGTMKCYGTLDAFKLEGLVHSEFHHLRLNGEWFDGEIEDFDPAIRKIRDTVNAEFLASNTHMAADPAAQKPWPEQ